MIAAAQNFGQYTAAQISASTQRRRFSLSHGGADFRQNFGQHTMAQILARKILREKNLRAEGPQIFFETVTIEQGFVIKKKISLRR